VRHLFSVIVFDVAIYTFHTVALRYGNGRIIVCPDCGKNFIKFQGLKSVIFQRARRFRRISVVPERFFEQITYFMELSVLVGLHCNSRLTYHISALFENHAPHAETVFFVARQLIVKPLPDVFFGKISFVSIHHLRVAKHFREVVKIRLRHFS
jgi:hypothetical protein